MLLTRVAVADGHGAVLERLVVNGDADWNADFIGPCIAAANGAAGIVHRNKARCFAERLVEVPRQLSHAIFFEQREDRIVNGCYGWRQAHQRVGFAIFLQF